MDAERLMKENVLPGVVALLSQGKELWAPLLTREALKRPAFNNQTGEDLAFLPKCWRMEIL